MEPPRLRLSSSPALRPPLDRPEVLQQPATLGRQDVAAVCALDDPGLAQLGQSLREHARRDVAAAPVEPPYDEETRASLEALGPPIALFRVFARRPERAQAIHGWGRYYTPDDPCWTDAGDRAVIRAVDALCDRHDLSDAQWEELTSGIGEEGAIDLLLVCGWYHAISFVARVARLPREPRTPSFLA